MCPGAIAGQDIFPVLFSLGEDEGGELYVVATSAFVINGTDGVVYQLVDLLSNEFTHYNTCTILLFSVLFVLSPSYRQADPRTCKRSGKFSV